MPRLGPLCLSAPAAKGGDDMNPLTRHTAHHSLRELRKSQHIIEKQQLIPRNPENKKEDEKLAVQWHQLLYGLQQPALVPRTS